MKYHTLSTSSLAAEGNKSSLTIYAGPDFVRDKMDSTESTIIRCELEMAQRTLKLQSRRCRQLLSEFTRKLQAKELQVLSERRLRDEQLAKVLRSLLAFEARLKQEQTFIRHQLREKDDVIQRQKKELYKLRAVVQYCKNCSKFYSGSNLDSCDSGSEYYLGVQENCDSGSEFYGSLSEYGQVEVSSGEEVPKQDYEEAKHIYEKFKDCKTSDGTYKRCKKLKNHRRMTGTYFEVLNSRESSNESSVEYASSDISDSQKTKECTRKVSGKTKEHFSDSQKSKELVEKVSGKIEGLFSNISDFQNTGKEHVPGSDSQMTKEHFDEVSGRIDELFSDISEPQMMKEHIEKVSGRIEELFSDISEPQMTKEHIGKVSGRIKELFSDISESQMTKEHVGKVSGRIVDPLSDVSESQKSKERIDKVSGRTEEVFSDSQKAKDHIDGEHFRETLSERIDILHGIRPKSSGTYSPNRQTFTQSFQEEEENISNSQTDERLSDKSSPDLSQETEHITDNTTNEEKELQEEDEKSNGKKFISDTITVFDSGDGEKNDDWYASASDQEDEEHRNIYRNNPVLECMNQILLQNINDPIISPPKSPEFDRNSKQRTLKRVKFSDENKPSFHEDTSTPTPQLLVSKNETTDSVSGDYYETPIQAGGNLYEVPQSIYSNDYEQILSKCGDSVQNCAGAMKSATSKIENLQENKINRMSSQKLTLAKSNSSEDENRSHYYIDMESPVPSVVDKHEFSKRIKTGRTPPALPPKPANLVSKFKIKNLMTCENEETVSVDSEPDYCSISELNLPPENILMPKLSLSNVSNLNSSLNCNLSSSNKNISLYNPISLEGPLSSLVSKNVEKNSFQSPKLPQTHNEVLSNVANITQLNLLKNKPESEIPKLPQVSEIIIPEETEESKKADHISQDNYIKNNSQIFRQKIGHEKFHSRIVVGTSVSNLVSSFNNQYKLSSQFDRRKTAPEKSLSDVKLFSSFEFPQSYEKQPVKKLVAETPSFEKFDLSQNFEEFNLDDCEIGEEYHSEISSLDYETNVNDNDLSIKKTTTKEALTSDKKPELEAKSTTSVEIVRATKDVHPHSMESLQQLQKSLSSHRNTIVRENELTKTPVLSRNPEPSYEHFLECTGLSSKSILTPSRILSNHKSMLKPKDIKLRSRVKSTTVFEHAGGTVKYWSEPYL